MVVRLGLYEKQAVVLTKRSKQSIIITIGSSDMCKQWRQEYPDMDMGALPINAWICRSLGADRCCRCVVVPWVFRYRIWRVHETYLPLLYLVSSSIRIVDIGSVF